jgi:guanylate kinase
MRCFLHHRHVPADRQLLVFIGPSGSGKSSVVRSLADRGAIHVHPTWTTRPRRADEREGSVEHHFVSTREFLDREAAGFFLHTVQMFGMPYWYGLPTDLHGGNGAAVDVVMLRAPLVPLLRSHCPELVVYQIETATRLTATRLAERGYAAEELAARLADNAAERAAGRTIAQRRFRNDTSLDALVRRVDIALREDFAATRKGAA